MGASNLGDLVATATLDISPFINNTRQLQLYTRSLDSSLKTVEASFKGQKDKLSGLKATYTQVGHSLKSYQELLKKQTENYNKLKDEIGDVNTATSEQKTYLVGAQSAMTATAAKVAELQNKYNALARDIAVQSSVWTKAGDFLTPLGKKMKTFGDEMASVGKSLTIGLTTPIMAGAGYAVKAAVQYESAFAGVKKTVDETATTSYEKLSNSIKQMSKELPASAAEIANVAEAAGQLGIEADNIMDFTRVMIDLGESTNLSATDAASAIAKIANITGMTTDQYRQFGSSLVALGNNFATTESDILQMANRMASAGTIAGLTNQEILGLATALSSVGIEAEAGGSAMSQTLVAIEKAVATGSDKLQGFADIADMTADQFAQKWKTSPAEALQSFINGLGQLDKKGESATLKLDELGLSGIRQSNMLKSLSSASDVMTDAITMSNEAWDKNRALTDEANKRYETTESKLKMLRNEVTDVAIEFGGPLVDALREGLEAVKPWLKSASDMAKAFSQLDKEQQQQIIKWGLIAAAAGPALSVLGKTISVTGSVVGGLGKMSTMIGKVSGALQTGAPLMSAFSGATTTATAASGGLASAVGLLGNPVTWGVLLGGAALVGVAMWAEKASQAAQRTAEWGAAVSKTEAQELSKFKSKVDETTQAMDTFGTEGVQDVEAIKTAFSELTGEISKLVDENLSKDLELAERLGLSDEEIQRIKDHAEQTKQTVNGMSEDVVNIYKTANEQRRQLSEEEKKIVLSAQTSLIQEQLAQLKYSGKEKEAITKAMNGQINELNQTQLAKALSTTKEWIEEENKAYKSRKKDIKQLFEEDKISQETYNREIEQLEAEHSAKMDIYSDKYIELQKRIFEVSGAIRHSTPEAQEMILNQVKQTMESLGVSYEEFQARMEGVSTKVAETSSLVSTYWEGMSEEARTAVNYWNGIVLDPVTGEVKTNAQEEIQKALQAEGGWEAMQLSLKEGRLTTTAKVAIGEALVATGQWDSLSPQEKALVVDGKPAIKAIVESKENLAIWNSMPEGVKKLLGENQQFMSSAETAKTTLNNWNLLQPAQKDLIANDLASGNAASAQQAINALTGKTVGLNADDLPLLSKVVESNQAVNSLQQTNVPVMNAVDGTGTAVAQAQAGVNSPKQNSPIPMFGLNSTGPAVAQTSASVNSPKQFQPIGMFAQNNTAGPVAQATQAVNSPKQHSPAAINAVNNASSAAKQATWDLNSIPRTVTSTITTFVQKIFKNEKGTNFHPGGLAMVNDQKGPLYKELVTLPNGESFIPEGRNVVLPLPRGTRVLKASDTKKLFPHYADGIGFENTGIARLAGRMSNVTETSVTNVIQTADDAVVKALSELLSVTREGNGLAARLITQGLGISLSIDGEVGVSGPRYNELVNAVSQAIAQELQRKMMLKGMAG